MKIVVTTLVMLFTLGGFLPVSGWAEDNTETNEAVPIDPNCTASPEVCQKRAIQRAARIKKCQENPEWCEQYQEKKRERQTWKKQFCEQNPEVCKKQREERKALNEQCKAQPDKCRELRRQHRQRKEQEQEVWCQANAERCKQWKAEQQQLKTQCMTMRQQLEEKYPDVPRP